MASRSTLRGGHLILFVAGAEVLPSRMSATEQTTMRLWAKLVENDGWRTLKMITDRFDERTIANMEVALDRACERFPKQLTTHEARKRIAAGILERATRGERTLTGLTEAAIMAATVVSSRKIRSQHSA
jgi:hypothetical protein